MTPQEKAFELVAKMEKDFQYFASREIAIQHALVAVNEIVKSNPHSNPLNTYGFSTMAYWIEVEYEIKKL